MKGENINLQTLKSLTVGAGETARWRRAFAALPGIRPAPSTDTGGLTQTLVPGCRHSFLAPEATADL